MVSISVGAWRREARVCTAGNTTLYYSKTEHMQRASIDTGFQIPTWIGEYPRMAENKGGHISFHTCSAGKTLVALARGVNLCAIAIDRLILPSLLCLGVCK